MIYEYAKIGQHHTVTYKDYSQVITKREISEKSKANLIQRNTGKKYNGYMSTTTARKVKEAINVQIEALRIGSRGQRKPTFVTLTLPSQQQHDDNYIKKYLLDNFTRKAKRDWNVKHITWRAEPQKNGNIHFHLLFDHYVDWKLIRGNWNRILAKKGYIKQYQNNMKEFHKNGFTPRPELFKYWSLEAQKKAYQHGIDTNWTNPNSTDIHALYNIKSVGSYICKYMTKGIEEAQYINSIRTAIQDEPNIQERLILKYELAKAQQEYRMIKGRIWGMSKALKEHKYFKIEVAAHDIEHTAHNYEATDYLHELEHDTDITYKQEDHFQLYLSKKSQVQLLKKYSPTLYQKYRSHYIDIYQKLYK